MASGSIGGSVRLWSGDAISNFLNKMENGRSESSNRVAKCIQTCSVLKNEIPLRDESSHNLSHGILSISWSHDGKNLISGTCVGDLQYWGVDSNSSKNLELDGSSAITNLKFNPSDTHFLCCTSIGKVSIFEKESAKSSRSYNLHDGIILDSDWKNDFIFSTGGSDGVVAVYDLREEAPVRKFCGHTAEVNALQWDPESQVLASASDDKTVKVWDLDSERPVYDFKEHEREVSSLSWSSSQGILASASLDTTVRLWDIQTGACTKVFDKHIHPVIISKFSPDGKIIASASNDRVFLWNCISGAMLMTYKCPGGINDLCWHPNGSSVTLACSNNNLIVLDMRL